MPEDSHRCWAHQHYNHTAGGQFYPNYQLRDNLVAYGIYQELQPPPRLITPQYNQLGGYVSRFSD